MSDSHMSEQRFLRSLANVFVTDFDRALRYYRDTLGFDVVFTYGDPPFYGEVERDDAAFYLRHVDESPFVEGVRDEQQLLSVSVAIADAAELFEAYQQRGVEFQERLVSTRWGAIAFVVRDPDGNLIVFSSPDPRQA